MKKYIWIISIMILAAALIGCAETETSNDQEIEGNQTREVQIFFLDQSRYEDGAEPYEVSVSRSIPVDQDDAEGILQMLFGGPTELEDADGLRLISSGCSGFSDVNIEDGVAHVYLTGECQSGGATYTIANLIFANLKQLADVSFVKVYDQNGQTEEPEGRSDSIPFTLEP